MRAFILTLILFFGNFCFSQEMFYGPVVGELSGNITSRMVFSSFKTGPTAYQLTSVEISNFVEGSFDSAFLYELDSNMKIVRIDSLFYNSTSPVAELGLLNKFKPFYPLYLKPRTQYGIFWVSGSNTQSLNCFSYRMTGTKNTGLKQVGNYYFDGTLTPMAENLIVILKGNES